ncbi:hypothetical protein N0V82_000855 [Gnomoniopsis sp. IMI 355080]|nr:hypothetical protein N0V82_000855 [Gnomoniopsis sp. IMI 355080]
MSNVVPDMFTDDVKPHCIWYPDVADEDTYRQLAGRYHVARACAVAGYDTLYLELDILPDVSIAEEARDNSSANAGSAAILYAIAGQPVCYSVMDDYSRSVNLHTPRFPAFMNGDTAVRSSLDVRLAPDQFENWPDCYFNIAEDCNVAEKFSTRRFNEPLAVPDVALRYNHLPPRLPTTKKDPLILMAAYEGNVDRYVRLRRLRMIRDELCALIRGIYHNTTFAKWSPLELRTLGASWWFDRRIIASCTARFMTVNDLSTISPTMPEPYSMPAMISQAGGPSCPPRQVLILGSA